MYKAVWSAPVMMAGLFAGVPLIFMGVVAAHDNEQAIIAICIKTNSFFIGRFFLPQNREKFVRFQVLAILLFLISVTPCLLCGLRG